MYISPSGCIFPPCCLTLLPTSFYHALTPQHHSREPFHLPFHPQHCWPTIFQAHLRISLSLCCSHPGDRASFIRSTGGCPTVRARNPADNFLDLSILASIAQGYIRIHTFIAPLIHTTWPLTCDGLDAAPVLEISLVCIPTPISTPPA